MTRPLSADAALFATAERFFEQKAYDDAIAAYQSYLVQYPDKPMADAALMKMGMIYSAQGNTGEEKRAFQRVLTAYPDSPFAPDARVAILAALYREGDYSAAMDQANILLQDTFLSRSHLVRIHTLLGDIQSAMGLMPESMAAYARAYDRAEALERPAIWELLRETISRLEVADIERFLETPPEGPMGGGLLYQLGVGLADIERDRESILVLSRMVQLFPDHEHTADAAGLLEILTRKSHYNRLAIGCLLPMTGAYKAYGQRALKGIELALSRFTDEQPDTSIQIIVKDTAANPARATAAVKELYEAQVAAIIGSIVTARAAAEEAQNSGIPIITLTGKEHLPDVGDYVFRNFITPRMQIEALVPYVSNVLGLHRFAILYPEEKYGTTLMNLFWDAVIENGGTVVGAESYAADATDFAQAIEKLVGLHYELSDEVQEILDQAETELAEETLAEAYTGATDEALADMAKEWLTAQAEGDLLESDLAENDPIADLKNEVESGEGDFEEEETEPEAIVDFDAVFIPDAPSKAGLIVPQLAFYDVENVVLMGTNLWHSKNLIRMAQGYVQGALVPDGFFADSELPHVRSFVQAYEGVFGRSPGFIEAVAYDSAMMLFELVSRPDMLFRSSLRDGIFNIQEYPGVTGVTSFTENGDVHKELFLLEIKRDRFRSIRTGN